MNTDTSKKPVGNQFSLKALIQASFQKKKAIPVENQLKTSKQNGGEPVETSYPLTGLAVSVTGSGVNQYSRQGEKRDFGAETEKSNRANQARIDFLSLPEKEPLPLEDMTTEEIIAAVHETFPAGAPTIYPTMPDWRKFCDAFPHCVRDDRKVCGFYQPDKACHCELFDKAFPGVGWWDLGKDGEAPATSQCGRRGTEEEPRYYIPCRKKKRL